MPYVHFINEATAEAVVSSCSDTPPGYKAPYFDVAVVRLTKHGLDRRAVTMLTKRSRDIDAILEKHMLLHGGGKFRDAFSDMVGYLCDRIREYPYSENKPRSLKEHFANELNRRMQPRVGTPNHPEYQPRRPYGTMNRRMI